MCERYLLSHFREDIIEILQHSDENKHFSLLINVLHLSNDDVELVSNFLKEPEKSFEEWNSALQKIQNDLILQSERDLIYKRNVQCRFHDLPPFEEFQRNKFPGHGEIGKFLEITGTVVRMKSVKLLQHQRVYICTKCKYPNTVNANYDFKYNIVPPKTCGNSQPCNGTNLVNLEELSPEFCKDYQEIKMQECVNNVEIGSMPNFIWVTLEDDLVDTCKPGDNISVCGWVKKRYNPMYISKKIEVDLAIKANHIQIKNDVLIKSTKPEFKVMFESFWQTYSDRQLVARDIILKSICPEMFGLYDVKLALAVILAGGSNHSNSNIGVKVRSEPHLLLVGDPGTGKSEFLKFASQIIPRSVFTTGVGSTAAGLTVAAVMENGEWQLEGGALVRSDGGICCIDEFNTMKEHDRTSILEAMEQQTISVAKASTVRKLSTKCSILAASNPKGNLDPSTPLSLSIGLPSPLLSRFDLILVLRDVVDEHWDNQLADYILSGSKSGDINGNWSLETMQAYFSVIKKIHPKLSEDSNAILSAYYQAQRRNNSRNKSRTTVRLLDSLVRLSQGHARLMYHENVEILDAVVAVVLVECGMDSDCCLFNLNFELRNDFPENPAENYKDLSDIVLKKLGLDSLLEKEQFCSVRVNRKSNSNIRIEKVESKFFKNGDEGKNCGGDGTSSSVDDENNRNKRKRSVEEKNLDENKHRKINQGKSGDEDKNCGGNSTSSSLNNEKNKNVEDEKGNKKANHVTSDLEALQFIPSINDIFNVENYDTFDEGNNNNKENENEPNNDAQQTTSKENVKELKKDSKKISPEIKNRFTKFRYVHKETTPDDENIFEKSCEISDISFSEVPTSTQTEKCPTKSIFEIQDFDSLNLDL